MRTLARIVFCATLAAGFGCAYTDYGVITDNDQNQTGHGSGIVDTPGPALHVFCKTVATIWPDGTDELFSFVDQAPDGTAVLTTYNNFSSGTHPTFKSDQYCNPDWDGCSIFTAPDNNDEHLFDGRANLNCSGARSFSVLLSTGRYYGECGRVQKVGLEDRLTLLALGRIAERYGMTGLLYGADRSNLTVTLTNEDGDSSSVPLSGHVEIWSEGKPGGRATIDTTNPLLGASVGWYASWLDRRATDMTRVTACYYGVCAETTIAGRGNMTGGARVRALRNARF